MCKSVKNNKLVGTVISVTQGRKENIEKETNILHNNEAIKNIFNKNNEK